MSLTKEQKRLLRLEIGHILDDPNWEEKPHKKERMERLNELLCPNVSSRKALKNFTVQEYHRLLAEGYVHNDIAKQLKVNSEALRGWVRRKQVQMKV